MWVIRSCRSQGIERLSNFNLKNNIEYVLFVDIYDVIFVGKYYYILTNKI